MYFRNIFRQRGLSLQVYQVEDVCEEEMPEESEECVRMDRTPPPPTLSPAAITVGRGEDLTDDFCVLQGLMIVEMAFYVWLF